MLSVLLCGFKAHLQLACGSLTSSLWQAGLSPWSHREPPPLLPKGEELKQPVVFSTIDMEKPHGCCFNHAALLSSFLFSRCTEKHFHVTCSAPFTVLPLSITSLPCRALLAQLRYRYPLPSGRLGQLSDHLPYPLLHTAAGGFLLCSSSLSKPLNTPLGQPAGRCQTLPAFYSPLQEQGQL